MSDTAVSYEKRSLALSAAHEIIEAALRRAGELNLPVAIAVVDEGAHLKAFARVDGAGLVASEVALNKAYTAAATGAPTSTVHDFVATDAAAVLSMPQLPRFMLVAGGLPISIDGAILGAIGVSGGTASMDADVAQAALAALPQG